MKLIKNNLILSKLVKDIIPPCSTLGSTFTIPIVGIVYTKGLCIKNKFNFHKVDGTIKVLYKQVAKFAKRYRPLGSIAPKGALNSRLVR